MSKTSEQTKKTSGTGSPGIVSTTVFAGFLLRDLASLRAI
jgi:hypothetical protein